VTAPGAPAVDPLAGTPYRLTRALGAGGMGEVVEAEHLESGQPVVIKLLHRHLFARPDLVDRMRLEGDALGVVEHPNVVAAVASGVTLDDRPYLVLERLLGRTLHEEVQARGPLPAAEALELAAQALDGLGAVHRAGLVHRDVKLDNLFVCDADADGDRVVKLLDLGVAKLLAGARPPPLSEPTAEGVSLGTPRWFSPEQATFAPIDARTDVYAMGLVLFALLTGRIMFAQAGGLDAVMRAHAGEPPERPSRYAPRALPAGLEAAVLRALAKRPEDRFPTAEAFAEELRRIAGAGAPAWPLGRVFAAVCAAALVGSAALTAVVDLARGR
jgi:serine/threonine-protein kinase